MQNSVPSWAQHVISSLPGWAIFAIAALALVLRWVARQLPRLMVLLAGEQRRDNARWLLEHEAQQSRPDPSAAVAPEPMAPAARRRRIGRRR